MASWTMHGRAMLLDEATSRECGHLAGINGEDTPDERWARPARDEVRRDAQILANQCRKSVEIYATHPKCQDWVVDVVEPEVQSLNSTAYAAGLVDGADWDLTGIDAYDLAPSGWSDATINALGSTACRLAWGVTGDDAWGQACADYDRGCRDSIRERLARSGVPPTGQ
jgi:hypothetical protein